MVEQDGRFRVLWSGQGYSGVSPQAALARLNMRMLLHSSSRTSLTAAAHVRAAVVCAAALLSLAAGLQAQVHKVTKPQKVVRAVGVYEWTGDLAKPAGSRLIPVSLFIDGRFQDADIYEANPIPFALDTGNVYELQKAGIAQGTLDLAFARKLIPTPNAYSTWDDGWFGYGKFAPPAPEKKSNLKPVTTLAKINGVDDDNDDKPHFSARSATPGTGGSAAPLPGSAPAADTVPADDPDRPKLHHGSDDKSAASDVPDDPDRPTLKKHPAAATPATSPQAASVNNDRVQALGSPMTDANRPELHRGKPVAAMRDDDIPKLTGLPQDRDLQQMVAVSDAENRPQHDFSRAFDDETERAAILGRMEEAARAALTAYEKANGIARADAAPPAPATGPKRRAGAAAHRAAAKKTATPPAAPEPLLDEKLIGYTLSYGGAATFVYSAHTDGVGSAERFVTIVAQNNVQGEPEIALKSVTDATHVERTPRFKLVDAVDADASNRASLLFELRAQNTRQFALYRVLGGRADQLFLTGSTQ
jgi:hypothetical protein